MRKSLLCRFVLVIIALIIAFSPAGCGFSQDDDHDEDDQKITDNEDPQKASNPLKSLQKDDKRNYSKLVINDVLIDEEDYIVETSGKASYIMLDSEVFKYTFKMPYASSVYPEFSTDNGQITITWTDQEQVILKVDMVEGSDQAYINVSDEPVDIGVAPETVNDKLYIPINLFVEALKMKETYDRNLKLTFIHCEENFPKDLLVGSWSDTDTDLFATFEDAATGAESLSSFAMGYQFNENGTYRVLLIGVGGFEDSIVQCRGKYKVLGNTIIYYDIYETLYEGNPFKLVHKNKKLENPSFEFIDDFDQEENQIEIGCFWLNKVEE